MSEDAKDDDEDDGSRYPRIEFVCMDDLVAEEGDPKGAERNDKDTGESWDIVVDSIDELSTDNGVHGRPAETSKHVEDRNDLHSMPSKPKPRKHHLAETEARAKGREVAHWDNADEIEEQANEAGVCEAKEEKLLRE